jgi:uncharacterized membrane protein YphA (DoxX/SURF4 family)
MDTYQKYSTALLRVGLSLFLLWFGAEQLLHGIDWVSWVPMWAVTLSGQSPAMIVFGNGVFELVGGVLLAFGMYTRWVAVIMAVHILVIVLDIGLTAIGVRDLAIAFAFFSLALAGRDEWSMR